MRNLKALALALAAMFALSAFGASAASADDPQGLLTGPEVFWLHGEDEEGEPKTNALTALGGTTECGKATYTGGEVQATTSPVGHHNPLEPGATDFTLTPHYSECVSGGGLPETVTMNGCDYDIHIGDTIAADKYAVTADLKCPTGKEVTIDIYANHELHTANPSEPLCTVHIAPIKGLEGGYLTDETNGHVTLGGQIGPFPSVLTGPSACAEKTVTDPNSFLDIEVTLTGRDSETRGNAVEVGVSDTRA